MCKRFELQAARVTSCKLSGFWRNLKIKRCFLICWMAFFTVQFYANDFQLELDNREYFGTVARATINDDNLNIRLRPSPSAIKIGKLKKGDVVTVKGYSDKRERIDNFDGYWLKITVEETNFIKNYASDNFGWYGWVFSKYVDIDPKIDVSTFSVAKVNPASDRMVLTLDLEIDRNGQKSIVRVRPEKFSQQESYCFVWSDDIDDFLYSDPVGTFRWNPKTNEITHITDMGYDCESAWCIVSDDEKYFFQDYGTSSGVRAFSIYDVKTNRHLYSGLYLYDLEYDGKSVVVIDEKDWRYDSYKKYESFKRSEEYRETLQPEDLEFASIVVRYRLRLDNLSEQYLDCATVHRQ